ncbi:DUF4158 domain-containing protein [Desulfocastanea catecholica]
MLPEEEQLLTNRTPHGRLGIAVLLKFFQVKGRFPERHGEVGKDILANIAEQVGVPVETWHDLDWEGRTIKRHRADIREWCGFREVTLSDFDIFKTWLVEEVIPWEYRADRVREFLSLRCRDLRIELPASDHISRLIQSALQEHETSFCKAIFRCLDSATLSSMNSLLQLQFLRGEEPEWTMWQSLKADPGKAGLESIKEAVARLQTVREIGLPENLFQTFSPKLLERPNDRVTAISAKWLSPTIQTLR